MIIMSNNDKTLITANGSNDQQLSNETLAVHVSPSTDKTLSEQQIFSVATVAESGDFTNSVGEPSEISSLLTLKTMKEKLHNKYNKLMKERSLLVDFLAIIFGIGTWLGVNSVFIELPLLVNYAPEAWSLPSYLSVMVQIGNLGALVYTLWQRYAKPKINDAYLIYVMFILGSLSLLFSAFFYNKTAVIFGAEHSIALFIFTIFISIGACTSSVLFMPYMGRFKEMYLTMFFVGEGLSGLLPSVLALIQGIGGSKECRLVNVTENGEKIYEEYTPPPRFDTMTFFCCAFALMVCSFIGYILLDQLKVVRKQYAAMKVSFGNDYVYEKEAKNSSQENIDVPTAKLSPISYWSLLILLGSISFFSNGMFNSIQSYSAMPYSDYAYHLSTTLSVIANPVACFIAVFLPHTSIRSILSLCAFIAVLIIYVFVTASMSPTPPLVGTTEGMVIIILVWTVLIAVISFTKLSITTVMRNQGGKSLVWAGSLTQIGSLFGSIIGFILVNFTNSFKSANPTTC